jgi:uncharacterized membrane protein
MRKSFAIFTVLMVFIAGYAFALMEATREIPSSANISTDIRFSVYESDYTLTELTFIDWGTVYVTQAKNKEAWIQNDVEVPLTISVSAINLNENITFSYSEGAGWDGNYPQLNPHQKAQVLLTLTPNENCTVGNFSFSIVISAIGG